MIFIINSMKHCGITGCFVANMVRHKESVQWYSCLCLICFSQVNKAGVAIVKSCLCHGSRRSAWRDDNETSRSIVNILNLLVSKSLASYPWSKTSRSEPLSASHSAPSTYRCHDHQAIAGGTAIFDRTQGVLSFQPMISAYGLTSSGVPGTNINGTFSVIGSCA